MVRRRPSRAPMRPGMAPTLSAAMVAFLPATALAAKSANAAANPAALELGGFLGRLRSLLPQTHFEWVDLGRTLLLHVDYWILIAVVYAFARRLTLRAADRKLRRVKAAMAYTRHRDATYTSVETGMLEWINHLLRHEWRAVISAMVDEQARTSMDRVMRDASAISGGVVRRAIVEEATFGVVPPDLKLYVSRYNPAEDYMQFEFDFRWDTVSSHVVIQAEVSVPGSGKYTHALGSTVNTLIGALSRAVPSARVPIHVTDLSISGRLLLGARLSERAPGVSGLDISFDGKPDVSVSVRPMGVPLDDIPGVGEFVEQKIGEVFAASYVEPKRYYQDVERLFLGSPMGGISEVSAGAFGPGGALVVDARSAERLLATNARAKTACPYLEVTYGGVTKRTPTRMNATDPDWRTRLVFPIPASSAADGDRDRDRGGRPAPLRFRVMDWNPLGEPRCIGSATQAVDLGRLRASAKKAAAARLGDGARDGAGGALGLVRHALPLRGARGGVLYFSLAAVDAVSRAPPEGLGRRAARASGSADAADASGDGAPDERDARLPEGGEDGACADDFGGSDAPGQTDTGERRAGDDGERPAVEGSDGVGARASLPPGGGAGSDGGAAAAARLLRLAKVQRARREETEAHRRHVALLTSRLRDARDSRSMEKERRDLELRRALVEGAAFTVHTKRTPGFEPGTYRLWYVASRKHIVWAKGARPGAKPKLHQFVPASLVKACVPGAVAFTLGADADPALRQSRDEAAAARAARKKREKFSRGERDPVRAVRRAARNATSLLVKKKQIRYHDPARCFSIALWKPDAVENNLSNGLLGSGAAGLGLATVDLELPEGGNGRGVREWCDAIMAVAEENGGGRLDLDDEEDEAEEAEEAGKEAARAFAAEDGETVAGSARRSDPDVFVGPPPGDDAEGAAIAAPAPARVDAEDTVSLRRLIALPERASVEMDDANDDAGGETLTVPIPPEPAEEDGGARGEREASATPASRDARADRS